MKTYHQFITELSKQSLINYKIKAQRSYSKTELKALNPTKDEKPEEVGHMYRTLRKRRRGLNTVDKKLLDKK